MTATFIPCTILIDEHCQIILDPINAPRVKIYQSRNDIAHLNTYYEDDTHFVVIVPHDNTTPSFVAKTSRVLNDVLQQLVNDEYFDTDPVNEIRDYPCRVASSAHIDDQCQITLVSDGEEFCFTRSEVRHIRRHDDHHRSYVMIEMFDDTFPAFVVDAHPMFFGLVKNMCRIEVVARGGDDTEAGEDGVDGVMARGGGDIDTTDVEEDGDDDVDDGVVLCY